MRKKYFFILPFWNFSDFELKIFQTFGQKTSWICQNYLLRVRSNNLWLEFFFKFWIVPDFLQKPLAWFSKIYLSVQSKKRGRKSFFLFFFSEFFSNFEHNIFRLLAKKLQKIVKTKLCVSTGTTCGFNFFFKIFEPFWIFCRNLWHGSQKSI